MQSNHTNATHRLWLVRHGATQWNDEQRFCGQSDIPLSTQGRRQAQWLARRLRSEQITAIYSSDLLRAQQTAEIIATHCSPPVSIKISAAWREIAFGAWEGLTYSQIAQQSEPNFFTDPLLHSPPGGESFTDLLQRTRDAFRQLVRITIEERASGEGGASVLVSHGGPLRVLLCSLLAIPLERHWQLRLDPGSLSALDFWQPVDETSPMATLALLNAHAP